VLQLNAKAADPEGDAMRKPSTDEREIFVVGVPE
jgi:hypothetical protein